MGPRMQGRVRVYPPSARWAWLGVAVLGVLGLTALAVGRADAKKPPPPRRR